MTQTPQTPTPGTETERNRWLALSAMRILAAVMVMAGLLIAYGERDWVDPAIRLPLGLAIAAIGFFDFLVVVPMLARRWRSPQ